MNRSESLGDLAAALAKAQGELENAHKNAQNPHFRSRYADLAEILNTVRPVLARHGLSVVQLPGYDDGHAHVETVLLHASGEWLSGTICAPVTKSDPQGVGSALTYLRRYSLAALAGIAQEDDDGQSATSQKWNESTASTIIAPVHGDGTIRRTGVEPATQGQDKLIRQLLLSHVFTDAERDPILAKLDAKTLSKLKAIDAIDWIQTQLKERKASETTTQETLV
jgi:hypothetical protein